MTRIFLFLLLLPTHLFAQQFEWASSGDNLNGGVKASVIDRQGNLVVVLEAQGGWSYDSRAGLYSSSGDSVNLYRGDYILYVGYDKHGKINWTRKFDRFSHPLGMGLDAKGNIVSLVRNSYNIYMSDAGEETGNSEYIVLKFGEDGKLTDIVQDSLGIIDDPLRFMVSSNGGYLLAQNEHKYEKNDKGVTTEVQYDVVYKLDENLKPKWTERVRYTDGHGYFVPGVLIDEAPDGTVYVLSTIADGATFQGKRFSPPVLDSVHQYNRPYEAYLASYSKEGKLKWVKNSGGKSIFSSIRATSRGVYIGGTINNNLLFYGKKVDTTGRKQMVLASFNAKGQLEWAQTTKAYTVTSIAEDHDRNVYAIIYGKVSYPDALVIENDTLRNPYENLLVISYNSEGKYRWVKHTKLPLNTNEYPTLRIDDCGNIFISGELWWVLKAEMKWFDAALVKGYGYGPMPFVAKLKNTLPVFFARKQDCVISPAPWKLRNFPNPFRASTTIEYSITYADPNVSLYVYDMGGRLISPVFNSKAHKAGTFTIPFNAGSLAKGVYVLVLRGTEAVATEQIVVL